MKTIASLKDISKVYNVGGETLEVLKGASLNLYEGESLVIMGPSGSGKSTLMHILGCLDRPTKGSYVLFDEDVSLLSDRRLSEVRAEKIGFVFQAFNLIPHLSVFENVSLPFMYRRHVKDWHEKSVRAIEKVGLSHRLTHKPSQLSGGEMQRTAIARALAQNPLFILADEPTGNLDRETGNNILRIFKNLNQEGTTLVIVTHDASVASHFSRQIHIDSGEICF